MECYKTADHEDMVECMGVTDFHVSLIGLIIQHIDIKWYFCVNRLIKILTFLAKSC